MLRKNTRNRYWKEQGVKSEISSRSIHIPTCCSSSIPVPVAFNPDIVRLDHSLHLLFVRCAGSISIFDEGGRGLKKLGDYFLDGGSHHNLAVDEATQVIYLPQPSVGDRPVLRVIKYVANGV